MKATMRTVFPSLLLLALSACAVGPRYQKPDVTAITPPDWHWTVARPDDAAPKGEWWQVFKDPVLDQLEATAVANNQNLRAAVARVDEARAAARITRSRFFPELSLDPSVTRERTSGNLPTPIPFNIPAAYVNTYSVPFDLSYELDLWGRVRRSFESSQAQAQASVSDFQNVLLTLTADVAVNYITVRALDVELATLRRTVELRAESVRILEARFAAGTILEIDLAQAKTELASARSELANTTRERAEVSNALALLCGQPAGSFDLPEAPMITVPVVVPPGLPSSLLERRPDIASAERNLAASNARIGVAQAAYFPAVRLTGQAGFLSAEAQNLFSIDNRVWSIGPSVSWPIFNAGRTASEVKQAKASYEEALANYRQIVLTAFKEVEDSLAGIVLRNEQSTAQSEALASARRVTELARARYNAGALNYLEVVDAERTQLYHERLQTQLEGQRLSACVRLIKALGGGWGSKDHSHEKNLTDAR